MHSDVYIITNRKPLLINRAFIVCTKEVCREVYNSTGVNKRSCQQQSMRRRCVHFHAGGIYCEAVLAALF